MLLPCICGMQAHKAPLMLCRRMLAERSHLKRLACPSNFPVHVYFPNGVKLSCSHHAQAFRQEREQLEAAGPCMIQACQEAYRKPLIDLCQTIIVRIGDCRSARLRRIINPRLVVQADCVEA